MNIHRKGIHWFDGAWAHPTAPRPSRLRRCMTWLAAVTIHRPRRLMGWLVAAVTWILAALAIIFGPGLAAKAAANVAYYVTNY